jgi:nucleoside-diphosphate-sugar epimerase
MRVLIVGCGYVGLALGEELVRQGHSVCGLRRSHRHAPDLKAAGIAPLVADVTVPESFRSLVPGYDWVVYCASASGGGVHEYAQIYLAGIRNLLSWLSAGPLPKLVYTSSTSVFGQTDGSRVDETSPAVPDAPTAKLLVESEATLLQAASEKGFPAVVLRVAGIYGPGRAYWLDQFRAGTARLEDGGGRILNMIHRHDVVGAIVAALMHSEPGPIYNAVDNEPVTQLVLFQWLSDRLGRPLPLAVTGQLNNSSKRGITNKQVSNQRLKQELGYRLKFPTFREGYESLLDSS